jgi:hypothetical protein
MGGLFPQEKKKKFQWGRDGKAPSSLPNDENKVCVPQPSSFLLSPDLSRRISFIFDPLALGMLEVDSPPLAPPRRQVSPLGSSCAQLPGVDAVSQSAVLGSRSAPDYLLA